MVSSCFYFDQNIVINNIYDNIIHEKLHSTFVLKGQHLMLSIELETIRLIYLRLIFHLGCEAPSITY